MQQSVAAGNQKPANGQLCLNYLSHPRGQAQQRALQAQGFYSGEAHRYLDEETMKALGEFQKQKGLKVSGVPTPRTRKALWAVGGSGAT